VTRFLLVAAALAGCTPSLSEVRGPVDADIARRLGPQPKADVTALLAAPLDQKAAVAIALANSARLQAAFDELGVAAGEVGAALGLGPVEIDGALRFGNETQLELDVVQNILGLITGGKRRGAARAGLVAAQAMASAHALRLVARVEIAFGDVLAAQQAVDLRRDAFDAADAAATVRERMHAAGNASDLAQARDRDAREQARLDVGRAETEVEVRRERLNALLGLSGKQTAWTANGALADLPAAPPALDGLETAAVTASLELAAGRARVGGAIDHRSDERIRTVLPELGLGVSVHDDGDRGTTVGPMIRLGIPLFDWRGGERMRANAEVRRAEHELTANAIELRASARAARVMALAAYQEAKHIATIVLPLRQQILDETLKHYNAMDADPFALVMARRELVGAYDQKLDALRRYWRAIAEVTALERGVTLHDEEH
jgi:outer membrane protein TolC